MVSLIIRIPRYVIFKRERFALPRNNSRCNLIQPLHLHLKGSGEPHRKNLPKAKYWGSEVFKDRK